jgi:glycosyltransferase involved in cell wall biosynthesis
MSSNPSRRPKVTIGLPVYNGERYLADTLDCLLAQTFEDFELVIADNASTDATAAICTRYAAQDHRIRVITNETNIGVYRNCNKLISLSTGEYFKLACADDVCHPQLVARCVDVLDADPTLVIAYAKTRFIDSDGQPLPLEDPGWHLMSASPAERMRFVIASGHWVNVFSGVTRTTNLRLTRLFPLYAGADCALLGELCLMGRFCEIPEYLFFRRIHAGASSQNPDHDWQSRFFKGKRGTVELPMWHVCLDHCRTIVASRLSARDKISCLGRVFSRMYGGKRELLGELHSAWKYKTRAQSFSIGAAGRQIDHS